MIMPTKPTRWLPQLIDAIPLYATDRELAPALFGERAKEVWPFFVALCLHRGLPPIRPITKGRYVPAVLQFLDRVEGVGGGFFSEAPTVSPSRSPASERGEDRVVRKAKPRRAMSPRAET